MLRKNHVHPNSPRWYLQATQQPWFSMFRNTNPASCKMCVLQRRKQTPENPNNPKCAVSSHQLFSSTGKTWKENYSAIPHTRGHNADNKRKQNMKSSVVHHFITKKRIHRFGINFTPPVHTFVFQRRQFNCPLRLGRQRHAGARSRCGLRLRFCVLSRRYGFRHVAPV